MTASVISLLANQLKIHPKNNCQQLALPINDKLVALPQGMRLVIRAKEQNSLVLNSESKSKSINDKLTLKLIKRLIKLEDVSDELAKDSVA